MTLNNKTPRYIFDGENIKKVNDTALKKQNYFERLYDEHGPVYDPGGALEELKHEREVRRIKQNMLRVLLFILVTALAVSVAIQVFFKVDNIEVTGSDAYSNDEIVQACGIQGMNMVFSSNGEIEEKIKILFPLIKSVDVEKKYPNTLVLTVKDNVAEYIVENDERAYLLSSQLDVMGECDGGAEMLPVIKFQNIKGIEDGQKLTTGNARSDKMIVEMLQMIKRHSIDEKITEIEISENGELSMKYDDRLTVMMGNAESFETKLTLAQAYVAGLSDDAHGVIDTTTVEYGSYMPL